MRIRRLAEDVANQIAAGEVVERPASAVKELVENALDADASRVFVQVEEGGRRALRVTDDGHGMSAEDAWASLERHATSKIRRLDDLDDVQTMGFRGEALPSIASVSRFRLTTRRLEDEAATRIDVQGGHRAEPVRIGAPIGTRVDVESLFFNVPARLKFMKRPGTEMGHITEALTRLALAWPRVAFRLESGDRVVLDAPAEVDSDPKGRLGRILGRAAAERLIPIPPDDRPHRIEVSGWISEPGFHERTSRSLYVFVNGRFVRDRGVQQAIQEAYRAHLERGRFPVVVLHLALPPGSFDVNVHPQKTEVRFVSSQEVFRAVVGALGRTLSQASWRPAGSEAAHVLRRIESAQPFGPGLRPGPSPDAAGGDGGDGGARRPMFPRRAAPGESIRYALREDGRDLVRDGVGHGPAGAPSSLEASSGAREAEPGQMDAPVGALSLVSSRLLLARYLVAEAEGRMFFVDARAAAEKARWLDLEPEDGAAAQQQLVPVLVRLDPRRASCLAGELETLEAMGLSCSDYGEHTIAVTAAPPDLDGSDVEALLIDLADEAARPRHEERKAAFRRRLARAVELPRRLDWAPSLLDRIERDARMRTGLDGHRTLVELQADVLARLFGHG